MRKTLLSIAVTLLLAVGGNGQDIHTVAGGNIPNNVPAASAWLSLPFGVAIDNVGNLYIVGEGQFSVFRVSVAGSLTVVAGSGMAGFSGDGGLATDARMAGPFSVAVDSARNLFIADLSGRRIRRVDAGTGIITTVAGNGTIGFSGDGGPATAAQLANPIAVAVDATGDVFIADLGNNRIRRVDATTGIITTVAGGGTSSPGDGSPATSARISAPQGVALDGSGSIFITDSGNLRVRRVDGGTGIITTVAGNGHYGFDGAGDGGLAINASFGDPAGIWVDGIGNIFIADDLDHRVRRVDGKTGIITTVAGNSTQGFMGDGGLATSANLNTPEGVTVDSSGNMLIADYYNQRIRRVDAVTGIITTIAGNATPGDGLEATAAGLAAPSGVALDASGDVLIADSFNSRIRRIDAATGIISTVAGNGLLLGGAGDGGPATSASFSLVGGVALDASGDILIPESCLVRRVDAQTGMITTVAGNIIDVGCGFSGDGGPATSAGLDNGTSPNGVALDLSGNLFISDYGNHRIRRVDAVTGIITTVAGNGTQGFGGDGGPATGANLNYPTDVTVDRSGNLFIADDVNQRIRRVDALTGIITTVAGNGTQGFSGDGGPARSATLSSPIGVTLDVRGNLLIADGANSRIRRVDATTGIINTVVGNGTFGFSGDEGPATSASLAGPQAVAMDNSGNLLIADTSNNRIRRVDPFPWAAVLPASLNFSNQLLGTTSAPLNVTLTNTGLAALNIFSITITGTNPGEFAVSENCGSSVLTGGNCTISVTFAPTSIGSRTGAITISDNASGSPQTFNLSGNGTGPSVSLSSKSVSFAEQLVGTTSAATPITVTNNGTDNLTIASVGLAGTNAADFADSADTCSGSTLSPNGTCTLNVTFTPSGVGSRTASLSISNNAANSPQTVSLSGTGIAPAVSLSSNTLSFANQLVSTVSAVQGVTVTNSGTASLTFTSIAATGDFEVAAGGSTCSTSSPVAAGSNCLINVTFTPTATGSRSGSLTLTDNASGSPQIVGLSGTGTAPSVSLSTTSLSFSNQLMGTTSGASAVTVTNNGSASLTLTGIAATGDFAVAAGGTTCSTSAPIAASTICVINLTFTPTATGLRTGSLTLSDNASDSPQVVSLSGTGTAPSVTLSTASVSFSNQPVGTTSAASAVTVTNNGTGSLTFTSIVATGDFAVAASGTTCSTSAPVAAGSNCVINVTFTPTAMGSRSGSLTLTDNASGSPQTISLSGTGTEPVVSLSSPLTFPAQSVGTTSSSQTVTLTNTGNGSLTFTAIAVTGPFAIATSGTTCSTSNAVAAAGTCTVAVTFTPTAAGAASGSLSFSDNAPNNPQTVALSGTGQDFSFAPPSGSSTSTTVAPGSPATYTLSVGGEGGLTGTVTFTCTGAPSEATCTVSPNPATAGSTATNVTVTVTTTAPSFSAPRARPLPPAPPRSAWLRSLLMLALALATTVWAFRRRNQRGVSRWRLAMVPLALGFLLALAVTGCGGGGGGGGGTTSNPGTPAGTYTLTVTGTAGSGSSALSHSVNLTLTVS